MKFFLYTLLTIAIVAISYCYIDFPLAIWVETYIRGNTAFRDLSANLPSKLLMLVLILSSISWAAYGYMCWKNINNKHRYFFLLLGIALPSSYILKSILKWMFGRMETRLWLADPESYAVHWFNGINGFDAFPSGHMLVMSQLFLALWLFYPRLRTASALACLALLIALIATNYHYLSDVIAGLYFGFLLFYLLASQIAKCSNNLILNKKNLSIF